MKSLTHSSNTVSIKFQIMQLNMQMHIKLHYSIHISKFIISSGKSPSGSLEN